MSPAAALASFLGLSTALGPGAILAQAGTDDTPHRVSREVIRGAMQVETERDYNLLATTNSTRFTTSVILAVVREAMAESPDGPPLLLHHSDWYEAYREITALAHDEIPDFVNLAHEHGQDRIVDYRPGHTRIEVKQGFEPELVVHVRVGWPEESGGADKYTFVDTSTSPNLRVTNRRRVEYWLLDFGDMIVQDKIKGISARPIGGALGVLFSVIGDGNAAQNRIAVTNDGLVVTYAIVKKGPMKVEPVTVTYPDGTVETEFPEDRGDLLGIANYIKLPLEIEYLDPE